MSTNVVKFQKKGSFEDFIDQMKSVNASGFILVAVKHTEDEQGKITQTHYGTGYWGKLGASDIAMGSLLLQDLAKAVD